MQVVILNTGNHWIAVKLEPGMGGAKDHLTVADSFSNGYEGGYSRYVKELYYIFRHIPLPPEQN